MPSIYRNRRLNQIAKNDLANIIINENDLSRLKKMYYWNKTYMPKTPWKLFKRNAKGIGLI